MRASDRFQPVNGLLQGTRLCLTPIEESDLPTVAEWYRDVDFLRHLDALPARPRSESQTREWLSAASSAEGSLLLGLRLRDDDRLCGYLELDGILWPHGVAGVALGIGAPTDRGHGLGLEAMRLLLAFAFEELGLHRLTLTAFDYNLASIGLARRLGFRHEGAYREFLLRDGRRHDMLLFGLLAPEWKARERQA